MFSCEFYEISKNTSFTEQLWATASDPILMTISSGCLGQFQVFSLQLYFKKRFQQRCFSVSFSKFLRTFFDRTPPDDCYLWILRSFLEHAHYRATLGNCLFHGQVEEFQPVDTVKNISQVFFRYFRQEREVAIRRRSFT